MALCGGEYVDQYQSSILQALRGLKIMSGLLNMFFSMAVVYVFVCVFSLSLALVEIGPSWRLERVCISSRLFFQVRLPGLLWHMRGATFNSEAWLVHAQCSVQKRGLVSSRAVA